MGGRIGRHAAIYGSGSLLTLAFGFVNVAVFTRLLPAGEFGRLALFLTFSALLTVIYNAGSLQGSFRWVFGSTGEEEVQDDAPRTAARDKRRALGSALVLTLLIAVGGTSVLVLLAPETSYVVTGTREESGLVIWAAVSGGLGAVWRLASNVLRLERRPTAYVLVASTRPVFALALAIPLVATGGGAKGALAGVALGTALSVAVTLVTVRRNFRFAFSLTDVMSIFRLGGVWVPTIIALWAMHNADVLLLSKYASDADVGMYRVAARIGAVMSYLVSAFLMAWGPLSVDPISAAVDKEQGLKQASATLTTYFALASTAVLLALAVSADVLVRIAPPGYADAAPLIPLIGAGFVVYGLFVIVYRTATLPRKQLTFIGLTVVSALVFLVVALVLIPAWGSYGAAVAVMVAPAVGTAVILALSQRGADPVPFEYGRVFAGLALAAVCLLIAKLGAGLSGAWAPLMEVLACCLFPALLVATGVVPRRHLRSLQAIVVSTLGWRQPESGMARGLDDVAPAHRELVEMLLRGRPPAKVAISLGRTESRVLADFVSTIREVAGVGPVRPYDDRIGAYLLSKAPAADKNEMARKLWTADVDPLELDSLTVTLRGLASDRRWSGARQRTALDRLRALPRARVFTTGSLRPKSGWRAWWAGVRMCRDYFRRERTRGPVGAWVEALRFGWRWRH